MTTRTPAQFKGWAIANKAMAKSVRNSQAFARVERARVDAYVQPIFQSFRFFDERGAQITSVSQLYLCVDEAMRKAFYDQCDAAHRAHGWTGADGHCPALTAENLLIAAEQALLAAGCKSFDLKPWLLNGDMRSKMLDLLLRACLGRMRMLRYE